jgi:hypothetical protein
LFCVVVLAASAWIGAARAGEDKKPEPQLRLEVDLVDGSRIIGVPSIESIPVETSYAKLDITLKQLMTLRIGEDHETATMELRNGDKLKGVVDLGTLKLETVFGDVKLTPDTLREVRVRLVGAGARVEWDLLPIPTDNGWGGEMGAAPAMDGDVLVTRGWPARSAQSYSSIRSVECDLWVDEPQAEDGFCIWTSIGTANQPRELLVRNAPVTLTFGAHRRDGSGGFLTVDQPGRPSREIAQGFRVKSGQWYRLRMEFQYGRMRVTVNDQAYDAGDVALPAGEYRVHMRGWRPADTWRVRNCVIQ